METTEIDELLHRYSHAEGRIAANLLELDDHPTYGLLTSGALTGTTAARVADVVNRAPEMWRGLDALRTTLERARAIRGNGRLGNDQLLELEAVLTRDSVLAEVIETPLGQRDLLAGDSVERRVSIDELLAEIRSVYEPLRDAVAAVDSLWRDLLPRLDAADTSLAALGAELHELGASEPTVNLANGQVRELRRLVMDDPLAIESHAGEHLDHEITEAAQRVGQVRHAHDAIDVDLTRTEVLVAQARALRARAAVAKAEAEAKISAPDGLVQVPGEVAIDALAHQGTQLRNVTGPWQHTRDGLDRWLDIAERMVAQLTEAERRNSAPIIRRNELRGLLSAYRAKAAAVGLIERPEFSELLDEAHTELFTAPADLARAHRLVTRLGAKIQSETATGNP